MHFLHIVFLFQFSLKSLWMWRYFTDWSLWNRLDNCLRFNQTVSSFIFISIRSNNSSDWYSIISFFILFYIFRNTPDSIVTIWLRLHFVSWTYILFILLLLKFIVSKIVKLHIVIALMLRILSWIRSYSFIFIFNILSIFCKSECNKPCQNSNACFMAVFAFVRFCIIFSYAWLFICSA